MTLGEGKRKVLMLIDEYSSGGTVTVDEDLNVRMADFFDLAQKNVSGYKKIIRSFSPSLDDPAESPAPGFIACKLPENFRAPFRVWKNGKQTSAYVWTENSILIPDSDVGSVEVEYIANPATIPDNAGDDYALAVDEDAAACMLYFSSAQQPLADLVGHYQPPLTL